MSRCQCGSCRAPALWQVDPYRPAFAYAACERHAREAAKDGWQVDGPDLDPAEAE